MLLPVIWTKERMEEKKGATGAPAKKKKFGALLPGGVCCGIALCAASLLQQFGIRYTSVGKAGFLTTLFIVIVPLLSEMIHHQNMNGKYKRAADHQPIPQSDPNASGNT